MSKFVIDSWAWIEYFDGSEKGRKVRNIVEDSHNEIITPWINVAEIVSIAKRKGKDYENISDILFSLASVFTGDEEFAVAVGKRHAEIKSKIKDFGLADACVLATAEKINARIVTGDPHFKNMKNVVML